MMGSKGEFDVFKEHTDVWNVGSFGDIADVGQRGGNAGGERAVNISALLKGSFFFFDPRTVESEDWEGTFENTSRPTSSALVPPPTPSLKEQEYFLEPKA